MKFAIGFATGVLSYFALNLVIVKKTGLDDVMEAHLGPKIEKKLDAIFALKK